MYRMIRHLCGTAALTIDSAPHISRYGHFTGNIMTKFDKFTPSAASTWLHRVLRTVRMASKIHSVATDHGELTTKVVGKRLSLLMAGDNDEVFNVYDKKLQRYGYVENDRAAFNCMQLQI